MSNAHLSTRGFALNTMVVLAVSAWLGIADFFLYSFLGVDGQFNVFGLIKVSFWGPSYLSIQLIAFVAAGLILSGGILLLDLVRSLVLPRLAPLRIAPLTVALLAAIVVALRLWKNGDSLLQLGFLCFLSVIAILAAKSMTCLPGDVSVQRGWRARILICVVAIVTPFSVAFFFSELPIPLFSSPSIPTDRGNTRPNVLLIVLDTVRADSLGCYNRQSVSTPAIDRIAREGLVFEEAYAAAPWTVPSHAAMFTGLRTGVHRAEWGNTLLDDRFVTLAELLSGDGYLTGGFSENPFVGRSTQMDQGFATFFEAWRRPLSVRTASRVAARAGLFRERLEYSGHTLAMFRRWHRDTSPSGRPFFAYINLMAAHLPRYPRNREYDQAVLKRIQPVNLVPEKFYLRQFKLDDGALNVMRSIYDEQIEHLDTVVGELRAYLEKSGVLDQTVVIITSDHGENFGAHGFIEHQFCLYNQLIRIPLILRYPPALDSKRVSETVSTIALSSTVASLVGVDLHETAPQARHIPLHLLTEDQIVVSESLSAAGMLRDVLGHLAPEFDFSSFDRNIYSVIFGDHKLIVDSNEHVELFDLVADPEEEQNVAAAEPGTVDLLSSLYVSPLLSNLDDRSSTTGVQLDPETLDALRGLGYIR